MMAFKKNLFSSSFLPGVQEGVSFEVWAGWIDSEVDWELAEQLGLGGHGQWHKV